MGLAARKEMYGCHWEMKWKRILLMWFNRIFRFSLPAILNLNLFLLLIF